MRSSRLSQRHAVSLSDAEEIDELCDELEEAWRSGQTPKPIEDYLESHGSRLPREALLGELLAVEVAYRILRGEQPVPADYVSRFPADAEVITRALEESANTMRAERLSAGTVLGHYRIEALVGTGGMGEVYRARDLRLGREVAIKVLRGPLAMDVPALERFAQEARALASMSHANILTIHDFGRDHGVSYFVMELLEGESLRDRIARGPMRWPEIAAIGAELAEGLAVAHAKGVVHRDLKPGNIFLPASGGVKILDFGLASLKGADALPASGGVSSGNVLETDPGIVLGTRAYMSPEQIAGEEVDGRTDIYALGCTMYEMATGQRYFENPKLEAPELVQQCLTELPEDRVETAMVLAAQLRRAAQVRRLDAPSIGIGVVVGLLLVGVFAAVAISRPARVARGVESTDENYLRGKKYLDAESKESLQKAIGAFESAIEANPAHAHAWAGLADAYLMLSSTHLPPAQAMPKAREAAEKALALDPELAEAHASLAVVRHRWVWDMPGAETEFRRALELDPKSAAAHQWYGRFLMLSGRFQEARAELDRARALSPLSSSVDADLAARSYYERRYDEALEQFLRVLAVKPDSFMARWGAGEVLLMKGELDRAIAELEKARILDDDPEVLGELGYAHALKGDRAKATALLEELQVMRAKKTTSYVSPSALAAIHVGLGEPDQAMDWLQEAASERDEWLVYLGVDPVFDRMRADPRFVQLLERVGL